MYNKRIVKKSFSNVGPYWTSVRLQLSTRGALNFAFGLRRTKSPSSAAAARHPTTL